MSQTSRPRMAALAVLTMCVGFLVAAAPAAANTALSPPATFPSSVTVGDTDVPAMLTIINTSTPPESAGNVTLTDIQLVPSCGTSFGVAPDNDCPAGLSDPGVFALSATGTGVSGPCAGQTFNIVQNSATGQVTFIPVGPDVVLTPPGTANDTCEIAFTFDVVGLPDIDASGAPGLQTNTLTFAAGIAAVNGTPGTGTSAGVVTVFPQPEIQIVKSVTPASLPEPGGDFTYDLVITNPGPTAITITSLTDDVYGNLLDPANPDVQPSTCDELAGDVLAANGGSTTCTFVGTFTGVAGDTEIDTVTVIGTDENGNTATDEDDAIVTIVPAPDIEIVKSVTPLSRPEPGGDFTYDLVITNPGPIAIAITSLTDDVYGNLLDPANPAVQPSTCDELAGDVLAANGGSTTCTFVGTFTGVAGDTEIDTVTVIGTDINGNTATDEDDAIVTIVPTPEIQIVKSVTPASLPEPGGDFTYDLVISNPGPIDIVITSLVDDVYGDLGDPANAAVQPSTCDELIGDTLTANGGSTTCTFVGTFTGVAGDTEIDTVTVIGTDVNGNTATDEDDAVVTIVPAPEIQIVKSVTPASLPEPGGDFTYDLVITNPGPIAIAITSLTDDVYGDLLDPANPDVQPSTCDELAGDVLAANGGSTTCTFVGTFTGTAGQSEIDTVTVIGTDVNGNTATDEDDAIVTIVPAPEIQIVKSVTPLSRPEPGGDFTYDLVITNPGPIAITITSLDRRCVRQPAQSGEPGRAAEHL